MIQLMVSWIRSDVSLEAEAVRWERARTSWATTANPAPLDPARAASTEAFSASKLVWKAIPSMSFRILEI